MELWPQNFRYNVPHLLYSGFNLELKKNVTGPLQGLKIRGGLVVMDGDNVPILVEIGWIDLQKTGGGGVNPPQPPACDGPVCRHWLSNDISGRER